MPATQARKDKRKPKSEVALKMAEREARRAMGEATDEIFQVVHKTPLDPKDVAAVTGIDKSNFLGERARVLRQMGARSHDKTFYVPRGSYLKSPEFGRTNLAADDPRIVEMRSSIAEKGILQPMICRWNPRFHGFGRGHSEYAIELVAGYSRDFCAELEHLDEVPVVLYELTDIEASTVSLHENLQRSDPSAEDLAHKFNALQEKMKQALQSLLEIKAAKFVMPPKGRWSQAVRIMSPSQWETFDNMMVNDGIEEWLINIVRGARSTGKPLHITTQHVASMAKISVRSYNYKLAVGSLPFEIRKMLRDGLLVEGEVRDLTGLKDEGKQVRLAREMKRRRQSGSAMSREEIRDRLHELGGKVRDAEADDAEDEESSASDDREQSTAGGSRSDSSADGEQGTADGGSNSGGGSAGFGGSGGAGQKSDGGSGGRTQDASLAVAAVRSIIRNKDLHKSIQAQISSAMLRIQGMSAAERPKQAEKIRQEVDKLKQAHNEWWAELNHSLETLVEAAEGEKPA